MTEHTSVKPWDETDWRANARKQTADMERLIKWYFAPTEHRMALWVAWNVSGMSPLAFHRRGSRGVGLYDIDPANVGLLDEDAWLLQNPIRNVAAAHRLWSKFGWSQWDVPPLQDCFNTVLDDGS